MCAVVLHSLSLKRSEIKSLAALVITTRAISFTMGVRNGIENIVGFQGSLLNARCRIGEYIFSGGECALFDDQP